MLNQDGFKAIALPLVGLSPDQWKAVIALVRLALQRAISRRKPPPGLLLHSDRGVQYTSESYRQLVKDSGITQSMSRLGNCWDNAVAESFFRSLKVEAITGYKLQTRLSRWT